MSDYKSKYNEGLPTKPANYLTDLMCEREAAKIGRRLYLKYWQDDFWKKKYGQHIIAVNSLLKIYEPQAIENALKRKEGKWILSFRVKQFAQLCLEEQIKIDEKKQKVIEGIEKDIPDFDSISEETKISKPFSKKNRINLDE